MFFIFSDFYCWEFIVVIMMCLLRNKILWDQSITININFVYWLRRESGPWPGPWTGPVFWKIPVIIFDICLASLL